MAWSPVAFLAAASLSVADMVFSGEQWAEPTPEWRHVDPGRLRKTRKYLEKHAGSNGIKRIVVVPELAIERNDLAFFNTHGFVRSQASKQPEHDPKTGNAQAEEPHDRRVSTIPTDRPHQSKMAEPGWQRSQVSRKPVPKQTNGFSPTESLLSLVFAANRLVQQLDS